MLIFSETFLFNRLRAPRRAKVFRKRLVILYVVGGVFYRYDYGDFPMFLHSAFCGVAKGCVLRSRCAKARSNITQNRTKIWCRLVCGVVGCGLCVFWHRVSKWGPKTSQMFNFWHHFHPILVQVGAKGDPKINTNNKTLKKR